MQTEDSAVWEAYSRRLTNERRQRIERVASQRLRGLRLVLDDVHHPHNISACLRSAEAFGVQHIDVISTGDRYRRSTAGKGVQPWLTLNTWEDRQALVADLRAKGYIVCAAFPPALGGGRGRALVDLPVEQPVALVFGNEQEGLGNLWKDLCDIPFHIPMRGFVESLNISVAAAISLYVLSEKILAFHGSDAVISDLERGQLLRSWCRD